MPNWGRRPRCCPTCWGRTVNGLTCGSAGPDEAAAQPADVVLISNGAYRLGNLQGFGTRQRMDGGVLGIVTLTVDRARDVPALLAAEAAGRVANYHGYREWTASEFVVKTAEPLLNVGVDGEALSLAPPLRFRIVPGALRVRTPVAAAGAAPAAISPAGVGHRTGRFDAHKPTRATTRPVRTASSRLR
jgi:hypothetical protein